MRQMQTILIQPMRNRAQAQANNVMVLLDTPPVHIVWFDLLPAHASRVGS